MQRLSKVTRIVISEKVFILIFGLLLLKQYFKHVGTLRDIMEKNPQFVLVLPSNTTIPPVHDDYDQLINLKNFTFLKNPETCKNYTRGLLLLIIVSSNPMNHDNRQFIRTTWGKETESTKIVFLMGLPQENILEYYDTLADQLRKESLLYGDIVQGRFKDSYHNMSYKHVMGLKWAAHHCPTAKYILKTDDDVFVHPEALSNFLVRDMSPWGARKLILCGVCKSMDVLRKKGRWKVTREEYADDYYPPYCTGAVIIYSQDVVRQLVHVSRNAHYLWIDDAMVTGILAQSIHIERTEMYSLKVSFERLLRFWTTGEKYLGWFLFIFNLSPIDIILDLWNARHELIQ